MAVESAADRAAFLDPDEFGVVATVTPAGGAAREINVLFDRMGEIDGTDFGTVTQRTSIIARTADVSDLAPGDAVEIEGTSYITAAPVADGHGMTTIPLRAA